MDVVLNWNLTLLKEEDRNGDDPRLQFAFLTTRHNRPITIGHRTELLLNQSGIAVFNGGVTAPGGGEAPLAFSGSQTLPLPPTADAPYLGFAVRAIEEDNSDDDDRRLDFAGFVQSVQDIADETPGGTPDVDALWLAANAQGIRNEPFQDDDDKIGVSARVYPDFGARAARAADGLSPGALIDGVTELTSLTFQEQDAHWRMNVVLRAFA
ncbi:MAG: hypothetical protein AAF718_10315 [Pseudomonadota bacterium]